MGDSILEHKDIKETLGNQQREKNKDLKPVSKQLVEESKQEESLGVVSVVLLLLLVLPLSLMLVGCSLVLLR